MSKTKKKSNKKQVPPVSVYPASPHITGIDWIELPVRRPAVSAELYRSIGFAPRGSVGRNRAVAVGGTVVVLKRVGGQTGVSPTGILMQIAVDNVELKRDQLLGLGLRPGPRRSQPRGDRAFEWIDPDGHVLRFVGPARRADDKTYNE